MGFRRGMDLVELRVWLPTVSGPPRTVAGGERFDPEGNLTIPPRVERVRLAAGALAGVDAERALGSTPHLSAASSTLMVNVGGDATADEITRMAESLQPSR